MTQLLQRQQRQQRHRGRRKRLELNIQGGEACATVAARRKLLSVSDLVVFAPVSDSPAAHLWPPRKHLLSQTRRDRAEGRIAAVDGGHPVLADGQRAGREGGRAAVE